MTDRAARRLLLGLVIAAGVVFATQSSPERRDGKRGPQVGSDGRYYYLVLRSLALDHDFDYTNDYAHYGNWYFLGRTKIGRPANPFGIGPALAWLPFFAVGHAAALSAHGLGADVATDGMSAIDQSFVLAGSFLYGALAVWLSFLLARRWFSPALALGAAVLAYLGGPLPWYQIWECSMAHAIEAAAASALVLGWVAWREAMTARRFAALGALAGALALLRPQDALLGLLVLEAMAAGWRRGSRSLVGPALALATGCACFAPQLLMWRAVYGRLLLVPQGSGFMRFGQSMWAETLFSSRNGLFFTTPLWGLGLLGLVLFARKERRIAIALGALFMLCAWQNGAAWDWWAGGAYSGRRFTALLPAVTLGAAGLFDALDRIRLRTRVPAMAAVATGLVLQLCLLYLYKEHRIPWDQPLPAAATWGQLLGAPGRALLRAVGNPAAWPASLPFALRYGVPPRRYEELVGPYLLDERLPTTNPRRIGRREERLLLPSSPFAIAPGRLLLPLNRTGRLGLRLEGTGLAQLTWNGHSLAQGPLPLEVEVAAAQVRRGLNEVRIEPPSGAAQALWLLETPDWPPAWALAGAP